MSFKRGQITMFIIIGIVIVITIILVVILGSRILEKESEAELIKIISEADISGINNYVETCLRDSLKSAVYYLGDKNVLNYKEELKERIKLGVNDCVDSDNLREMGVTRIPLLKDIIVEKTEDNIFVTLNWPLIVQTEKAERKLEKFNTVYPLVKDCCVPVLVDNNCRVEENVNLKVCNVYYQLSSGDSLKAGGDCLAC